MHIKKLQDKKRSTNAQMTSTVKLVKSSFFEPSPYEDIPDQPSIDDQIKWPSLEEFSKESRQVFLLWTVEDDFLLIGSHSHVDDFNIIYQQCTFSHLFTIPEIRRRIEKFTCDPVWRDLMQQRINKLDPDTRMKIDSKIPFNGSELAILASFPSTAELDVCIFLECLIATKAFGYRRTASDLKKQWEILRNQELLADQVKGKPYPADDAKEDKDFILQHYKNYSNYKLDFSSTDYELPYPTGMHNEDECQHIASLRYGDFVFTMEMPMTIIGCRSSTFEPDIDLNLFGESERIVAKQAALEYDESRQFMLKNIGKFPIVVNGSTIITEGNEITLPAKCVIKFDRISLIFRISGCSTSKFKLDWNLLNK